MRQMDYIEDESRKNDWQSMKVPSCENDVYAAWFVYMPAFIGVVPSVSSFVKLDCRAQRMRQGLKSRLRCRTCAGRSTNVGTRPHVEFMYTSILSVTGASTTVDMDAIGMYDGGDVAVVSDVDEEHDEDLVDVVESSNYVSNMKRNLFRCVNDDAVLLRTMKKIHEKKKAWNCQVDTHYFFGKDSMFTCDICKQTWRTASSANVATRPAKLHTLHHGCI